MTSKRQDTLVVTSRLRIPLSEMEFSYVRSSGPGGQNVNKVNSKAVLRWPVSSSLSLPEPVRLRFEQKFASRLTAGGELVISSQRYRDQGRNAVDCLEKLKAMISAAAIVPRKRKPTAPTRSSVERRIEKKKESAQKKQGRRPPKWE